MNDHIDSFLLVVLPTLGVGLGVVAVLAFIDGALP